MCTQCLAKLWCLNFNPMIKRLLRNLRQKPKIVRDNIALGIASTFTFIVGSFWLYNFSAIHGVNTASETKNTPAFSGLFSDFKDQIATIKESAQNELNQQATSTPSFGGSVRERIDIKDLYPPQSNTQMELVSTSTTIRGFQATTSTSSFSYSIASTTTNQQPINTKPTAQPVGAPRSIRIITTDSSTSTSATTTFGE